MAHAMSQALSGAANEQNALKELHNMISRHENSYPDAAMVILGDFNHCDLRKTIPRFYQFVNFPTRGNSTLDKCYSNIKRAYTAVSKPHFGKCDHLAILLQPIYIRRLKADPDTVRTVNMWTDNALMELQGCLEATDMNIFKEATDNIHDYTDTVSSNIDWCTSICIPSRTIRVLPNQKPWFNADVRIKLETGVQPSNQVTTWSISKLDMNSKNPSGPQRGHTPRDLRTVIGKITPEGCGKESRLSPTTERMQTTELLFKTPSYRTTLMSSMPDLTKITEIDPQKSPTNQRKLHCR